jgi:hypothetical protein
VFLLRVGLLQHELVLLLLVAAGAEIEIVESRRWTG